MTIIAERAGVPTDVARLQELIHRGTTPQHYHVALLGLRRCDTASLLERVRQGLSFAAFERFRRNVLLSGSELANLLQIPKRTLSRRREQGRLMPDESDRLIRASRIFAKALELFEGHFEGARTWLVEANKGLGNIAPIEMAETEVGAREVENLIDRLEYGVIT